MVDFTSLFFTFSVFGLIVCQSVVSQQGPCPQGTSSHYAKATINIGSDLLNVSGVVEFVSVTVTSTCPTTLLSSIKSTISQDKQPLMPSLISNQTVSSTASIQGGIKTVGTKPTQTPTAINNITPFTSSGERYRPALYDSLVILLAGAVQIGIA